jgi:putative ABC transport system permease protein
MLWSIASDVRFAVRTMVRSPLFSAVAIVTLALGIGANSAVFSAVNAILLRPLPFDDPDRLVIVKESSPQHESMSVSYPNMQDWREQNTVFTEIAAYRTWTASLTGGSRPERVVGSEVSAQMFSILGVTPVLGRFFVAEENDHAGDRVVVLSYEMWQRRYGGDPEIVGRTIELRDLRYTVVGIAPPGFVYPLSQPDVEMYVTHHPDFFRSWDYSRGTRAGFRSTARLKEGVSLEQARTEMAVIAARLEQEYPRANGGHSVVIEPLQSYLVGDMRLALLVLLAAVALVLLIACANVANLLLARASARAREIAIRSSLGAGTRRVLRQLLTESVVLSLVAGAVGVMVALWGVRLLSLILPSDLPVMYRQIAIDGPVLGFTLGLTTLTGIVFGLFPAAATSRQDLAGTLREEGRAAAGSTRRSRFREGLVVAEIALALVLLVSAALMMRSVANLTSADRGFKPDNLLTMQVILPQDDSTSAADRAAFYEETDQTIGSIPGVTSLAFLTPMLGGWDNSYVLDDRPAPPLDNNFVTDVLRVSADYFPTMEIPLVAGRNFSEQDRVDTRLVAIIDAAFAAQHWNGDDPIGKRVKLSVDPASNKPWYEIVGVVGHAQNRGVEGESRPVLYLNLKQNVSAHHVLLVRTESRPERMKLAVHGAFQDLIPTRPVYDVRTMREVIGTSMVARRITLTLLAVFAGVALALAASGTYGVVAYSVSLRTHEFGIRMAMGAGSAEVLQLVFGKAAVLATLGVAVGVIASLPATALVSSMLFGVAARDPGTLAAVGTGLVLVALVASIIPALRATKVQPLVALRE